MTVIPRSVIVIPSEAKESFSTTIRPGITPFSRIIRVNARVSMPEMPGTFSRLSQSLRLSTASQWL